MKLNPDQIDVMLLGQEVYFQQLTCSITTPALQSNCPWILSLDSIAGVVRESLNAVAHPNISGGKECPLPCEAGQRTTPRPIGPGSGYANPCVWNFHAYLLQFPTPGNEGQHL